MKTAPAASKQPKKLLGRPKGGARKGAGRPRGVVDVGTYDGRIAARNHAERAMQTLVSMLTSPSHPTRVAAANSILDRAYGRPSQQVEVTGKDGEALPAPTMIKIVAVHVVDGVEQEITMAETMRETIRTIDHK